MYLIQSVTDLAQFDSQYYGFVPATCDVLNPTVLIMQGAQLFH